MNLKFSSVQRSLNKVASTNVTALTSAIFGTATIVSLGASLFAVYYSLFPHQETLGGFGPYKEAFVVVAICMAIVGACSTLICFAFLSKDGKYEEQSAKYEYLLEKYNGVVRVLSKGASTTHNIVHYLRNAFVEGELIASKASGQVATAELKEFLADANKHFIMMLSNVKTFMDSVTEAENSVCIKLYNDQSKMVKTLYRDPMSNRKRRVSDFDNEGKRVVYGYRENTGFRSIVDFAGVSTFACDDLRELSPQYDSRNSRWKDLYTATLVVPIQCTCRGNGRKILGFIAVDNLDGGLDDKILLDYLASVADIMFIFLENVTKVVTAHETTEGVMSNGLAKELLWKN